MISPNSVGHDNWKLLVQRHRAMPHIISLQLQDWVGANAQVCANRDLVMR